MQKLILLLLFLLGAAGVFGLRFLQVRQTVKPFVPQPANLKLEPPGQALTGIITALRGTAQKLARDEEDFQEASAGASIVQGESLAIGYDSVAEVDLGVVARITLGQNSETDFANLIPENLLFRQKSGNATYNLIRAENLISVRVLHALLTLNGGEIEVDVDGSKITVTVTDGTAKLGLVDLNNETQVWDLADGQEAIINDETRSVRIF